jgi:hypothetical protein
MTDLSILFLTVNKVPEKWAKYQREVLMKAIGNTPLITISRVSMDWGTNIIQEEPFNSSNIYKQMLRGAKMAKTPYIAVAEDDALYPAEHFKNFRPKLDEFAYNSCRWGTLSWGEPTYFWADRISNLTFIGPRELTIKALEERFAKYPNGTPEDSTGELGRKQIEARLRLPSYKVVWFGTTIPVVYFCHDYSLDPLDKNHKKRRAMLRAYDIPYWGKASELQKKFV